jgi:hypothetical protein
MVIYYIYENINFIDFRLLKYCLRIIKIDNNVLFHKLANLHSSLVPHERTNATTEALVDALYALTFLLVTLCFSGVLCADSLLKCSKSRLMRLSTFRVY